jgi:selenocysteine lyase/cysteine desulfurase
MLTPLASPHTAGLALVHVEGLEPGKLVSWMMANHHIVVTGIAHPEFDGLRITPNVYTTVWEVDLFAEKLIEAVRKGIA